MQTAEEEAWEENFYHDFEKTCNEILATLINGSPFSKDYEFKKGYTKHKYYFPIFLTNPDGKYVASIGLEGIIFGHPNKKIKWAVKMHMRDLSENIYKDKRDSIDFVAISLEKVYTKRELDIAKKQLLAKILDYFKKL